MREVPGLYRLVPLRELRRTPGVWFDNVPMEEFKRIDAIDRVIHEGGAVSPGPVGDVERPWYMHPHQDDNLIVLHGVRHVDLYTHSHGKVESFEVRPEMILEGGDVLHEGPAMLVWPCRVFHRIVSSSEEGSASLNFAIHYEGWDIKNNFNIYGLDTVSGEYTVLREGHLDQNPGK